MLLRDRQLRTQIYQLKDAGLFALSLWLAHWIRDHAPAQLFTWKMPGIEPFEEFVWLYLVIIPGVPLILASQGFYQRPILESRRETAWLLFKSCVLATVGVILVMFLFRITLARSVFALFGVTSFILVMGKEEVLRLAYRTRFGQLQLKKRVLLVGAQEDTSRMRRDLLQKGHDDLEIV